MVELLCMPPELARYVLSKLPSTKDVLLSESVCRSWRSFEVPLPTAVCIDVACAAQAAWLGGNLERLQHLTLTDTAGSKVHRQQEVFGLLGRAVLARTLHIEQCHSLHTLPSSLGNLQQLQHLSFHYCNRLTAVPASLGKLKV